MDVTSADFADFSESVEAIASSANRVAASITPPSAGAGRDAADGHVASLTEAVMGMTAGLCRIAGAIEDLADAVRREGS